MTIIKPKRKLTQDEFINGAPDAGKAMALVPPASDEQARRRIIRGKKEQLTLTLPPATVDQVDQAAASLGLSRTAWITQAINLRLQEQARQ